jgi:hypothetical protein
VSPITTTAIQTTSITLPMRRFASHGGGAAAMEAAVGHWLTLSGAVGAHATIDYM